MKNQYAVKVSENDSVRKLEDLPFGRLMELVESIKEASTTDGEIDLSKQTLGDIKKSLDDNNVKLEEVIPVLMKLQVFLDEQNNKKTKVALKAQAKEKLLTMKYLLNPIINGFGTQKAENDLLNWLCDLEESSIEKASKAIKKPYAGYTIENYVKHLKHIRDLFKGFVPKSYKECNPRDKQNYEKIFNIIEKVKKDIKDVEESPDGMKVDFTK